MERGPYRVKCSCGETFIDVDENESHARHQKHIREKAEMDDLLHFMDEAETVEWSPTEGLDEVQKLAVESNDIARQLNLRNFGQSWTSKQEAELLRQLMLWMVRKEHMANHLSGDPTDEPDWKNCRRMTCTYVTMTLGGEA